jgi:hypothetical protein
MNTKLSELQKLTNTKIKEKEKKTKKIKQAFKDTAWTILMVVTGISYTVSYYEYQEFRADYLRAIEIVKVIENRPVVVESHDSNEADAEADNDEGEGTTDKDTPLTVEQQIEETAKQHGFNDVDLLKKIAFCESSYRADARNAYSTATGPFQYLAGTWEEGCQKTGNTDWTLDDRMDVEKATRMAIWHISTGHLSKWNASANCWNS